ncbi:gamma-butyrobetaine dioxygenase-like [Asterias rubens]|uniref:gamma-butyrobetaine dioxygenase-like n=1 Tax=Asterias rubens TaxID=7604 RepID=UPI001455A74F|nr:gamma-butyrobetaine dioxygenase-like [Asterias rubens]
MSLNIPVRFVGISIRSHRSATAALWAYHSYHRVWQPKALSTEHNHRGYSSVSSGRSWAFFAPPRSPFEVRQAKPWVNGFLSSYAAQNKVLSSHIKVEALSKDDSRGVVAVTWSDGEKQDYPFIWLRDNCFCSQCYHSESQGRLSFSELDITACPESVGTIDGGDTVRITWNQHHHTDLNSVWLRTFRFDQEPLDDISSPVQKLWSAEVATTLPVFEFHEVLYDDTVLFEFLKAFNEVGIAKVNGVPTKTKQIPVLAKRVGPMVDTSFGMIQPLRQGGYQEENLETERSLSYTNKGLQLHTDMSCLSEPPAMAFFHCIKASDDDGGYSQFSDGFKAADFLRQKDPEAFQMLCTNQQVFRLVGEEPHVGGFDHHAYHTPIKLDHEGQLKSICYSTHARLPSMRMAVNKVEAMYSALQKFHNFINSPENVFNVKLKSGEMMVVNNHRVLHGRTAFDVTSERHLELGYVQMDHVTSRMRVLQTKMQS